MSFRETSLGNNMEYKSVFPFLMRQKEKQHYIPEREQVSTVDGNM